VGLSVWEWRLPSHEQAFDEKRNRGQRRGLEQSGKHGQMSEVRRPVAMSGGP